MSRILITYGVPMEGFAPLGAHELIAPPPLTAFTKEELLTLLPDVRAVVACTPFDAELIQAARQLELIVCYGAGYDGIDVSAATANGVMVCNTPECVTAPTAELAIALLMAVARRVPELDARVRHTADAFGMGRHMGTSLDGATLGVVGMGRIGSLVADFGRLMGMRVVYCGHAEKPQHAAMGDVFVSLPELMAQADFITLHCPLTPQTRGLITRELIALMKPTACLVNTARGAIIDEIALIEALEARRIAGAGLDVFTDEPNVDKRLLALDNVVLTPHVGSNTVQARKRMAEAASRRILDAFAGRVPQGLLNPQARA